MEINPFQNKITKVKKLGKDVLLQVSVNSMSNRIFVEFSTIEGKLKVQKSFQNSFEGKKEAKEFEKKFKSLKDLRKYFGLE
jgi:hypothetical protein